MHAKQSSSVRFVILPRLPATSWKICSVRESNSRESWTNLLKSIVPAARAAAQSATDPWAGPNNCARLRPPL